MTQMWVLAGVFGQHLQSAIASVSKSRPEMTKMTKAKRSARSRKPAAKRGRQSRPGRKSGPQHVARLTARMGDQPANINALSLAVALPREHPNVRMPTVDMPRTAVLTVTDQFQWKDKPAFPPIGLGFQTNETVLILLGQPGRNIGYWSSNLSAANYTLFFDGATAWNLATGQLPQAVASTDLTDDWGLTGGSGTGGPHGSSVSVGYSGVKKYTFLNQGDTLYASAMGGVPSTYSGTVALNVYTWAQGGRETLISGKLLPFTLGAFTPQIIVTAPVAGYYSLGLTNVSVTAAGSGTFAPTLSITLQCLAGTGWCWYPILDLDPLSGGDGAIAEEVRSVATSVLVTNTSAYNTREGTILAARIRGEDPLSVTRTLLARSAEKYTGDAAMGVYTFMELSEGRQRFDSSVFAGTQNYGMVFDLEVDDYFHYICISAAVENTFIVSTTNTVEFKTDSARYAKDVARGSHGELVESRRLINSRPEWFYENPLHMRDIYGFVTKAVKQGVRGLQTISPYAAALGGMLQPSNAAAYAALSDAVRKLQLH